MDKLHADQRVSRAAILPSLDQAALGVTIVLVCSLGFLLGEQATALQVSADEMGLTAPQGSAIKQAILASIYAGIALLLVTRTRAAEWTAIGIPLALLLVLCFASAAWSDLPAVTIRRSIALAGTMVLGTFAALRLDEHQISKVLVASGAAVLLASFAVAALLPAYGFDPEGRLRGVFAHKNGMGSVSALTLLVALVCLPVARTSLSRAVLLVLALSSVAALALAGSATATIALLFAVGVLMLQGRYGARASIVPFLAVLASGILAPLLAWKFGEIALLFGREADFSGRTRLWLFCLEFVQRSPVFGYGYSSFWVSPAALIFQRWSGFPVPNAHNGYLDLALGVGIVGVALPIAAVLRVIWAHSRLGPESDAHQRRLAAVLLSFLLVMNITENTFTTGNGLETLLFIYLVVRANMARTQHGRSDVPMQPLTEPGLHGSGVPR
jgi:exopolysaccharide production protein ExoQ